MVTEIRSLEESVVVITGATSGIGRATARHLLDSGARVVATGRRRGRLDGLLEEYGGGRLAVLAGDITEPATASAVAEAAIDRFGRIDSLILSAGVGSYGGILDLEDDAVAQMVHSNILGTIWPIRAAVPEMIGRGGGDIVIVASVAGLRGGAHEPVYAATKFAQVGLAGAIDRELLPKGIRVSTIAPAAVSTEFAIGTGRSSGDAWLNDVLTADDVAAAIVFTLRQPRRMRTQLWSLWSQTEGS